jgi:bacterioferritin-associated ferredoxin
MSFIQHDALNTLYQPGWFLASGDCKRETVQVNANHAQVVTKADGSKYVPAGAVIPSNDGNAKGLLYEDVDVSTGAMPGSLVTEGKVYEDRLPASVQSSAKAVLGGITFVSAAPAIGCYVREIVEKSLGVKLEANRDFVAVRKGIESFKDADDERRAQLIENNPLYGRIICRCEMITEGEIVAAIKSPVGAVDLDGVKRRTRAGMGRCQSGFCSPRVTEILSRELGIPMTDVRKNGGCSYILTGKTR